MAKKTKAKEQQPTLAQLMAKLLELERTIEKLLKQGDRSVVGFCLRQGISESHYFDLKKAGLGPRVSFAETKQIITPAAEREWQDNLPTTLPAKTDATNNGKQREEDVAAA
jgi:hypothetical protein